MSVSQLAVVHIIRQQERLEKLSVSLPENYRSPRHLHIVTGTAENDISFLATMQLSEVRHLLQECHCPSPSVTRIDAAQCSVMFQ